MAITDLPDWMTQVSGIEAEAYTIRGGADANKSAVPTSKDVYLATDTKKLYVCVTDGAWTGFDASIIVQGIFTLYADMVGGGFEITDLKDPTAAQSAATRAYVLAQKALCLLLIGGTMSGAIAMGTNKITGLAAPAADADAARKVDVDAKKAKELFIPVTFGDNALNRDYQFPTAALANANYAAICFQVPDDFTTLVEAKLSLITETSKSTTNIDLYSTYASGGQTFTTHTQNDTTTTYNLTVNKISEIDLSGILSSLAAGDYVSIRVLNSEATIAIYVIGVQFRYS